MLSETVEMSVVGEHQRVAGKLVANKDVWAFSLDNLPNEKEVLMKVFTRVFLLKYNFQSRDLNIFLLAMEDRLLDV